MQTWNLLEIDAPGGSVSPAVLATEDGTRAVLVSLQTGQELGDHQVKERAWLVVVDGVVRIDSEDGIVDAGPGTLATFAPDERHSVSAPTGARILLLLAPWPGEGHYRGEEKSL
jgi:quercetin dioxygenase-like cupin family protein